MDSYKTLQERNKSEFLINFENNIDNMFNRNRQYLFDFGSSSMLKEYFKNNDVNVISNNLENLINHDIDYIMVYNNNGLLTYKGINNYIDLSSYKNVSGFILEDDKNIGISSINVRDESDNIVGNLVFGFIIDDELNTLNSAISPTRVIRNDGDFAEVLIQNENKEYTEITINKRFLNVDKYLSFNVKYDKEIEALGIKTSNSITYILLLSLFIFASVTYIIVISFVKRMEKISNKLSSISEFDNKRLEVRGNDELSNLSFSINNMLDKIFDMNSKLIENATRDMLTGVYNRRVGFEKLEKLMFQAKKTKTDLTICFIDVNDLKLVNDKYGHRAGDEYLKKITELISRNIRDNDFIFRLGGDEFLVVFKNCNRIGANRVISRINKDIDQLNSQFVYEFNMSISKGIVTYDYKTDINDFVEIADKKMYLEKSKYKRMQKRMS